MKRSTLALCLIASVQAFNPSFAKDAVYQPVSNFSGNGYELYQPCKDLFSQQATPVKKMPLSNDFKTALAQQQAWLREIKRQHQLSKAQQTVLELPSAEQKNELDLTQFDAWLSPGEHCGNTLLTGYVSPELRLKRKADAEYKFPIYKTPPSTLKTLSRDDIVARQDDLKPYIIGFSNSELDLFLLQVQGSGLVEFIDTGEKLTLGWAGNNSHPYQSLGKHLVKTGKIPVEQISVESIRAYFAKHPSEVSDTLRVNQSYVFFQEQHQMPVTANGTNVFDGVTAAVDDKWIPLGAMVLLEYPELDAQRKVVGKHYKLLLSNDRGGAIKGAGRVDIYHGTDELTAGRLNHYGRVWVLISKNA